MPTTITIKSQSKPEGSPGHGPRDDERYNSCCSLCKPTAPSAACLHCMTEHDRTETQCTLSLYIIPPWRLAPCPSHTSLQKHPYSDLSVIATSSHSRKMLGCLQCPDICTLFHMKSEAKEHGNYRNMQKAYRSSSWQLLI